MGRLGLRALGGQQIKAAAAIDRLTGLAHRIVVRRRLIAMTNAVRQPLSRQRRADHSASIVEYLDEIMLLDAALRRILRIQAYDPIKVAADIDAMVLDIEQ